jgi:LytS/YehU family sensor histidine kinase
MLAMFFNYNLKLSQKQVELKKEIQEVERVNGKEKRDIAELQAKVKDLENQLSKYEKQ